MDPYQGLQKYLKDQINPFSGITDPKNWSVGFSTQKSKDTWQNSYVSLLTAGGNIVVQAKDSLNLLDGVELSAEQTVQLLAGTDLNVTALEEKRTSKSSGWGISLSLASIGLNTHQSKGSGSTFDNAVLVSKGDLIIDVGGDMAVLGGNLQGQNTLIDVAGNLTLASLQDTWKQRSSSFGIDVGFGGPIGISSLGLNVSSGRQDKAWTNQISSITATDSLDITVGKHTSLRAALLGSSTGDLTLDTASLSWADNHDRDYSRETSFGFSADLTGQSNTAFSGSFSDEGHDRTGITRATVGGGTIRIRDLGYEHTADTSNPSEDLIAYLTQTGNSLTQRWLDGGDADDASVGNGSDEGGSDISDINSELASLMQQVSYTDPGISSDDPLFGLNRDIGALQEITGDRSWDQNFEFVMPNMEVVGAQVQDIKGVGGSWGRNPTLRILQEFCWPSVFAS